MPARGPAAIAAGPAPPVVVLDCLAVGPEIAARPTWLAARTARAARPMPGAIAAPWAWTAAWPARLAAGHPGHKPSTRTGPIAAPWARTAVSPAPPAVTKTSEALKISEV